ncbi:Hypothetical predicted protein [Cloeon dipterum]|uniref:BTB domain-containing protein n=1 Tax=Cloeon dipterum TaxID=197152 RepID=A0A8S1CH76_9INSE|nr:Hypothetical predicted protein [Cloeon dipterum]
MFKNLFSFLEKSTIKPKIFNFSISNQRATELVERKIAALSEGLHTDCSFLVGPEDSTAQVLHAYQCDLKLGSEVFDAMLRNSLSETQNPIRIKHHESRIFEMLLQYIHVHCLQNELETLEEMISLSLAADEYLVEPLLKLCVHAVKNVLSPDNVWLVLNSLNHRPEFAAKCVEVLATHTMACLKHPSFVNASTESLLLLLKLKRLNINSELDLVNACVRWSQSSPKNHIRSILPRLRLLNLQLDEISCVSKFLNGKEKAGLAHAIVFKDKSLMPSTLCCISYVRKIYQHIPALAKTEGIIEIVPKELLSIALRNQLKYELTAEMSKYRQRNVISFTAAKNMFVVSLKILSRINKADSVLFECQEYLQISTERRLPGSNKSSVISSEHIQEPPNSPQTFLYSFKEPIYLPEGTNFWLHLNYGPGSIYTNFFTKGALSASMPRNRNLKCREGGNIAVRTFYVKHNYFVEGNKFSEGKWEEVVSDKKFCIVTSLKCKFF